MNDEINPRTFFVSYSRHDHDWAEWISWQLENAGHRAIVQHWDSVAGTDYLRWIEQSIQSCDHVVVVLSEAFLRSPMGQKEFDLAYQLDPTTASRRLIPVRVQLCEPKPGSFLAQLTYFDIFGLAAEQCRMQLLAGLYAAITGRARPATEPPLPTSRNTIYRSDRTGPPSRATGQLTTVWTAASKGRAPAILAVAAAVFVLAATASTLLNAGPYPTAASVALALLLLYLLAAAVGFGRPDFVPAHAADDLARSLRAQWTDHLARLRLYREFLPVRWDAAPGEMFDDWDTLIRTARGPGRPRPDTSCWATGPSDLRGRDGELADLIDRIPTRRLVLLGEPGSGKSTALVRFVVDRIAMRAPGDEVPVLVSMSTWDPTKDFFSWIEERLISAHPHLRRRVSGPGRTSAARALVEADRILLVLDGLDEMPARYRASALAAVSHALMPGTPLVISSRTTDYRAACDTPTGDIEVGLEAAAGIELLPVRSDDVRPYLRLVDGRRQEARWDRVLREAEANPALPVAQALRSPLMVWLARTSYGVPRSYRDGHAFVTESDPGALLDLAEFSDRSTLERHLLARFVPSAFQDSPYSAIAEQAFRFLAAHLRENRAGTPDIYWWEIPQAAPVGMVRSLAGVLIGSATGVLIGGLFAAGMAVFGVAAPDLVFTAGLFTGITAGVSTGLTWLAATYVGTSTPAQRLRWSPQLARVPLMLAVGLGSGVVASLAGGTGVGIVIGTVGALLAGARSEPIKQALPASPIAVLRRDRSTFLALALVAGMTGALVAGIAMGLVPGLTSSLNGSAYAQLTVGIPAALLVGLIAGLGASALGAVWGSFTIVRLWLAFDRQLPRRLFDFLDDACERGVLRQAGVAYQFRHIDIQHHLAPPPPSSGVDGTEAREETPLTSVRLSRRQQR